VDAVVAAAIGPLITALLAALGFWLRDIRQRRNREQAYRQALDQAREQVDFIEGWLRTHQQLASPEQHEQARQRALADLQQAYARVDQSLAALRSHKEPLTARSVLVKLLLLESRPHTTAATVLGVLYYVALAWFLLFVSGGVLISLMSTATNTSDSLLADVGMALGLFLISLTIGVAPALPLYWLAVSADRRRGDAPTRRSHRRPALPGAQTAHSGPPSASNTGKDGGPYSRLPPPR
jgi:hypothetical protein